MRATVEQTVAGLLPKRTWQRAEKSGKRCPQNVDFSEINVMEKTLNQKGRFDSSTAYFNQVNDLAAISVP
jgi:hypothetical protein